MWLDELCRRWFGRSRRLSRVQRRRPIRKELFRFRPRLEILEGRTLLSGGITTTTGLISAINSANTAGGSTTITLASNTTFDFTSPYNSSQNALPVITGNITIQGSGDIIERTGTTPFRFFDVASGGSLTLENMTLTGGLAQGTGTAADGGAIFSSGTLNLSGVSVKSNVAQGSNGPNGAGSHLSGGNGVNAYGGGLYVAGGTVTLNGDTLSSNKADGGNGGSGIEPGGGSGGAGSGGGLYMAGGTVTLNNDTLSNNKADGGNGGRGGPEAVGGNGGAGSGGGLYVADGAVTLNGDNLSSNTADGGNGGVGINRLGGSGGVGSGGGLYVAAGSVNLTNDTLSGNDAHGGNGGNISLPEGSVGISGSGSGGGLYVAGGTVKLTNDTLSSNKADGGNGGGAGTLGPIAGGAGGSGSGGGLYVAEGTVTLTDDTLNSNKADGGTGGRSIASVGGSGGSALGGGLDVAGGTVTLNGDALNSNKADGGNGGSIRTGGGLNFSGGSGGAGSGGGLYEAGGIVTLNGDTLNNNKAVGGTGGNVVGPGAGGGGGGAGSGGGIFSMFDHLTVINSTLSGNTAQGGTASGSGTGGSGTGGALFNLDATATLTYVTVANNSTIAGTGGSNGNANGGGVYNLANGNTVPAGGANTATLNLINSVIGQDSGGHDLVNDSENGNNTNTAQILGSSSVVQDGAQQLGNGTNSVAAGAITVTSAPNLATTLANNGGLTQTLAPNSISPVLGAGNADLTGLPSVDQRGLLRPNATSTIKPDDGAYQTQTTTTTVTSVTTAYTSAGLTVALTADVDLFGQQPITEGQVQFSVDGVSQTATIRSSNPGVANATITLPNTVSLGGYTIDAAYADPNSINSPSIGTGAFILRTANSSLSVTDTNNPIAYNSSSETLALQANVTSSNGGAVNEGDIVFTVNGVSSAPVPVSNGAASTTLLLSGTSLLNAGSYPNAISAAYTDAATNDFAAATATGAVTVAAETTAITTPSISSTHNSTTAQTVTLSASVASSNNGTVNEGSVTFTVQGTNLTATGLVHNGTATATLTLPASFAAGVYSLTANYADNTNGNGVANFIASTSANAPTLTVNAATVTTTLLNIATPITIPHGQAVTLAADVSSANGGTVNEGTVTFTVINPNGANLTATGSVNEGTATATLKLPNNFAPGTYVYVAAYADSNNGNGVPNFAAQNGVGTVDPPGSATGTLTVTSPPAVNSPVPNPPPSNSAATPPTGPVGSLTAFALGLGPTGIDLFEVDSQGDIFAQGLFGGSLQLVSTSLQLPLVLMGNDGLLALLAADNEQEYFIDVFNPLLPSIESAVLAGDHS